MTCPTLAGPSVSLKRYRQFPDERELRGVVLPLCKTMKDPFFKREFVVQSAIGAASFCKAGTVDSGCPPKCHRAIQLTIGFIVSIDFNI